jgi:oxygen-dependent protoporphyrinogen oxidase
VDIPDEGAHRPHIAVIGGGVAGLTAAFHLVRDTGGGPAPRVTVYEGAPRAGGKLRVSEVAGVPVDEGAESMLARRPEGVALAAAAGLGDALVTPAKVPAALLSYGELHPFPARQIQGVPADVDALADSGVLSPAGLARVRQDPELPPTPLDGDVSVAAYVSARLGREVVDRLVEPLLGGVYAGRADRLSLAATLPGIYRAAQDHPSLLAAAHSLLPPPAENATSTPPPTGTPASDPGAAPAASGPLPPARHGADGPSGTAHSLVPAPEAAEGGGGSPLPSPQAPHGPAGAGGPGAALAAGGVVFATVDGGMGRLPEALTAALVASGSAEVRTGVMVRELARTPEGWRLTLGPACHPEYAMADAVIVAVPARPASRLLSGAAPAAAARLARIEYASMAIITLAFPASAFPERPKGSGYLVPAVETDGSGKPRAVKAVTFVTTKWPHIEARAAAGDLVIVRCSVGRHGDEHVLQRDDAQLAALAVREIAEVSGVRGAPVATRVTRWGGGLPQYEVGHLDLVADIRTDVAAVPGLAVCGAAYDGVGVPACAATARRAADLVRDHLAAARQWDRRTGGVRGSQS